VADIYIPLVYKSPAAMQMHYLQKTIRYSMRKSGIPARLKLMLLCGFWAPAYVFAQAPAAKQVNQQSQFWTSINSVYRFNERWGMLADFHIRRNNFMADPGFYFIRGAANYWIKDNMTVAMGYGHMWLAPTKPSWQTFANEERIYQQFQATAKNPRSSILQRVRNEQRWQQKIVDDKKTGNYKFTDRVRYLFSYNYTLFPKNKYLPSAVLADELAIQFGKEVVYNTFDQNRLFIGIKQNISPNLSVDFGYMNVYQQKATGYQYDMNHTMRLFFYYTGGWKKESKHAVIHSGEE